MSCKLSLSLHEMAKPIFQEKWEKYLKKCYEFLPRMLNINPCPAEEANWSGSALFAIKYLDYSNNPDQIIWLAEN